MRHLLSFTQLRSRLMAANIGFAKIRLRFQRAKHQAHKAKIDPDLTQRVKSLVKAEADLLLDDVVRKAVKDALKAYGDAPKTPASRL